MAYTLLVSGLSLDLCYFNYIDGITILMGGDVIASPLFLFIYRRFLLWFLIVLWSKVFWMPL